MEPIVDAEPQLSLRGHGRSNSYLYLLAAEPIPSGDVAYHLAACGSCAKRRMT